MHEHDKTRQHGPDRGATTVRKADADTGAPHQGLRALQSSAGNAAVVQMLRRSGHSAAQEQHQHGAGCGHQAAEQPAVQRSAVHDVLRGGGRPLDEGTRTDMEARLGADFSDVRIHDDSAAKASAAEVGARAYTSGSHVVIGDGGSDRHTLAHELTHVIQQRQGPVAGTDDGSGLKVSDPSDRFEREAEATAHRVLAGPAPEAPAADVQRAAEGASEQVQRAPAAAGATAVQRAGDPNWRASSGSRILDIIVGRGNDGDSPRRELGGFLFGPECRNNGGKNLISRPIAFTVSHEGTTAKLAVHLNVMLTLGNETGNRDDSKVTITGSHFHLTARPMDGQNRIEDAGASILTAQDSVHVGPGNAAEGWNNRPGNTENLARAVGIPADRIAAALNDRFPAGNTPAIAQQFARDAGRAVIHGLSPEKVTITWAGDNSFPV
ncbi:eCIS core domain-containing protein [Streptomyces luteocolor]|uniref:eCIS core domain-containing protein n=1 Tax=Streptomyces luteocolor TaxID=285500 RepID=UPI000B188DFF